MPPLPALPTDGSVNWGAGLRAYMEAAGTLATDASGIAAEALEVAELSVAPSVDAVTTYVSSDTPVRASLRGQFIGRGEQIVDVRDYGGKGDYNGTAGTDNYAAFTAALAAAPEGGTLFIPAGRYYLSDTFLLNKSVQVAIGSGGGFGSIVGTELVFAAGKTGINIIQGGATNMPYKWRIAPLSIKSLSTAAGSDVGIFINAGRGCLEGVTVTGFGSHGVHVKAGAGSGGGNANNNYITQLRAYGNRGDGLRLEGSDSNATIVIKADVVANFGWGINVVGSAMNKIIAPHADQQYNGSPGAYRDAGNSNDWDWPYVEGSSIFLIDTGSSNGRLSCSMYGAPTIQYTGAAPTTWRIQAYQGSWFTNYVNEAGSQQYRIGAGGVATDSFDILNVTSSQRILSVNASSTRMQHFLSQQPNADGTLDMGTTALRWRNVFTSGYVKVGAVTSASRPTGLGASHAGAMIFDTTLNKPLWWNGTVWKDATGTTIT